MDGELYEFSSHRITSYQQALDAAEKATRQGLDNFEKATEAFEKAAQQLPKMPGAQRANKPPTP